MDIKAENVEFKYDYSSSTAIKNITFNVEKGEFIAIIGANGSGKSTLAKHIDAVLPLQKGKLEVLGKNVADESTHHVLRREAGMVFQNPDSQFVSSEVSEDVAFGLINYNEENIKLKVEKALKIVDMVGSENRLINSLSGGQKQRIAIAGVIALEPQIVIFDEATSMIDPKGREETITYLKKINAMGKTVIMITHYTEEAAIADRVIVMKTGEIIKNGKPREILSDLALLNSAGLCPPFAVQIYYELKKKGIKLSQVPLTDEELAEEICLLN